MDPIEPKNTILANEFLEGIYKNDTYMGGNGDSVKGEIKFDSSKYQNSHGIFKIK
ncbi:MAG: hypothetical protein WD431_21115 [Cyclobacteriaceae bacterium]